MHLTALNIFTVSETINADYIKAEMSVRKLGFERIRAREKKEGE